MKKHGKSTCFHSCTVAAEILMDADSGEQEEEESEDSDDEFVDSSANIVANSCDSDSSANETQFLSYPLINKHRAVLDVMLPISWIITTNIA